MPEHARSDEIEAAITQCRTHAGIWKGTFFRMTTTKYANSSDLLTGEGSRKAGARWTPPGLFRSGYGSLDPHTAMTESLANYEDRGIPISQAMPLVVVGVIVQLQTVLDIASPEFLNPLGLSIPDLMQVDWRAEQLAGSEALTQAIGRKAFIAGLEAILVPSARAPVGRNIVVFPQ